MLLKENLEIVAYGHGVNLNKLMEGRYTELKRQSLFGRNMWSMLDQQKNIHFLTIFKGQPWAGDRVLDIWIRKMVNEK